MSLYYNTMKSSTLIFFFFFFAEWESGFKYNQIKQTHYGHIAWLEIRSGSLNNEIVHMRSIYEALLPRKLTSCVIYSSPRVGGQLPIWIIFRWADTY